MTPIKVSYLRGTRGRAYLDVESHNHPSWSADLKWSALRKEQRALALLLAGAAADKRTAP
jgi:hypothetical protein